MLKSAQKISSIVLLFFTLTFLLIACGGEAPPASNAILPANTVANSSVSKIQVNSDLAGPPAAATNSTTTTDKPATAESSEATPTPPAEVVQPTATVAATKTPAPTLRPPIPVPGVAITGNMKTQIEQLAKQAATQRGLNFQYGVDNFFITRSNLASYYREEYKQATAEEKEESKKGTRVLQALGLLPKKLDEKQSDPGQQANLIAGFYSSQTKKFYLVVDSLANKLSPYDKITAVHELTHALQDQAFDLYGLKMRSQVGQDEWNDDRYLAITSLIEGDATHNEYLWIYGRNFTSEDIDTIIKNNEKVENAPAKGGNDDSYKPPLILVDTLYFPYEQGYEFVKYLYKNGGNNSINQAFTDYQPVSTAQILHPEKFQKRIEPINVPLPSLPSVLGKDWKIISTNVMGELQTRIWLEAGQANRQAYDAANGWAGDRYEVVENSKGDTGYVWRTLFEKDTDTEEFARAAMITLEKNHKLGKADTSSGIYSWTTNDLEVSLTIKGREVLITVLPKGAGIEKVVKAIGF